MANTFGYAQGDVRAANGQKKRKYYQRAVILSAELHG
jgi:hypothetical protein